MTPGSGGETSSVIGTVVAARRFYSDEGEAKKRWIVLSKTLPFVTDKFVK